jgi:malonyl-CoA/methylmalonyl-CoA synthetase
MPDKTTESFRGDYFITGDLVKTEPDGRISIVGRGKDLVITGGLNVYPREVEDVINALPGVLESAVIGVPHPDFGEGLVALIVPADNVALNQENLRNSIKMQLSAYKIPKMLLIVDKLPRNAMGKVQKAQLRKTWDRLFISLEN